MSAELDRVRTAETPTDKYDHEIRLVDTTAEGNEAAPQLSSSASWRRLARNPTRTSVKEQLSRRKYASWRKDRFDDEGDEITDRQNGSEAGGSKAVLVDTHPENEESQTVDFARPADDAITSEQPKAVEPMSKKKEENKADSAIDILYENQRGSFFCGIPLYSHSSLLNFDPAAWVTRDFKDSPVNITNAQVPDPSWMWSWKTWYVDMSHDVDEEGWQYSFSFGKRFAWHGTHPWFHSFVRRRRWLRKRVKRTDGFMRRDKAGTLEAAHHLTTDYFTIHSNQRERSPIGESSNPEARLARPVSVTSFRSIEEENIIPEEIKDIPSLMKAIKLSAIDREKVDAVKLFISTGGDELFYLKDNMAEIMASFVFQNSRRQILQFLKDQAEQAQEHRDQHDAEDRPEGPAEKRRIDNLLNAAEAATNEIHGLEYWSDRKHVLQTEDELDEDGDPQQTRASTVGEIRGISDKAETTTRLRVDRRLVDKGKNAERAKPQSEGDDMDPEQEGQLGKDSVLIPDDDNASLTEDEAGWKGQTTQPLQF